MLLSPRAQRVSAAIDESLGEAIVLIDERIDIVKGRLYEL